MEAIWELISCVCLISLQVTTGMYNHTHTCILSPHPYKWWLNIHSVFSSFPVLAIICISTDRVFSLSFLGMSASIPFCGCTSIYLTGSLVIVIRIFHLIALRGRNIQIYILDKPCCMEDGSRERDSGSCNLETAQLGRAIS